MLRTALAAVLLSGCVPYTVEQTQTVGVTMEPSLSQQLLADYATVTPTVEVSVEVFITELAQYGTWVESPDYGRVFVPTQAGFVPYADGYWVWTEHGWAWMGNEPYAWAVYRYGRWVWTGAEWAWIPGTEWAPSWVEWRLTEQMIGWCPLGPVGYTSPIGCWQFVGVEHFLAYDLPRHCVSAETVQRVYVDSRPVTRVRVRGRYEYPAGPNPRRVIASRDVARSRPVAVGAGAVAPDRGRPPPPHWTAPHAVPGPRFERELPPGLGPDLPPPYDPGPSTGIPVPATPRFDELPADVPRFDPGVPDFDPGPGVPGPDFAPPPPAAPRFAPPPAPVTPRYAVPPTHPPSPVAPRFAPPPPPTPRYAVPPTHPPSPVAPRFAPPPAPVAPHVTPRFTPPPPPAPVAPRVVPRFTPPPPSAPVAPHVTPRFSPPPSAPVMPRAAPPPVHVAPRSAPPPVHVTPRGGPGQRVIVR